MAKVLPNKAAATLNKAAIRAFRPIPQEFRHTLILDNGNAWERGLNEHTN